MPLPVGKKGFEHEDSKTQPGKCGGYSANSLGSGAHDFNTKGKVVSNEGSDYHDGARSSSGLHGNFAEKDASLNYLLERNKKGIELKHSSGDTLHGKVLTDNVGPTAYNSKPIPEVYHPGTSQNIPSPDPVTNRIVRKSSKVK